MRLAPGIETSLPGRRVDSSQSPPSVGSSSPPDELDFTPRFGLEAAYSSYAPNSPDSAADSWLEESAAADFDQTPRADWGSGA